MRKARLDAGFETHKALGRALGMARPAISRAESPRTAVPSVPILTAWAKACRIPVEEFLETVERIKNGNPGWFGPWLEAEQIATRLRFWEPIVVPGICQTEPYMRCLVKSEPVIGRRLERQKQVLGRAQVTAVVDHRVLSVGVGSPAVMSEQCGHLVRLAESEEITLHVVPAGADIWLGGALAIASHKNLVTVNMATMTREIVSTAVDMVEEAQAAFDSVLGAAMAVSQSVEFTRRMEEKWN
jgi:transcriptional regulator with XRE-family HTH domain